ncbi:MAG: helix-turn-helix domain-containing protein [Microcoleus sp.]
MKSDRQISKCQQTVQKWLDANSYTILANEIGVQRQIVSKWFNGHARPNVGSIVAMSKVLEVHPIDLGALLMVKWIERQLNL